MRASIDLGRPRSTSGARPTRPAASPPRSRAPRRSPAVRRTVTKYPAIAAIHSPRLTRWNGGSWKLEHPLEPPVVELARPRAPVMEREIAKPHSAPNDESRALRRNSRSSPENGIDRTIESWGARKTIRSAASVARTGIRKRGVARGAGARSSCRSDRRCCFIGSEPRAPASDRRSLGAALARLALDALENASRVIGSSWPSPFRRGATVARPRPRAGRPPACRGSSAARHRGSWRPSLSSRRSTSTRTPPALSIARGVVGVVERLRIRRDDHDLHRRHPHRELAAGVLDVDADEALERSEQRAVQHHRLVLLAVGAGEVNAEARRQVQVRPGWSAHCHSRPIASLSLTSILGA